LDNAFRMQIRFPSGPAFALLEGNLLTQPVEVIVNAANGMLAHGGGVAAAISRAAGETFDQESRAYVRRNGPVATGGAVFTSAGKLPFQGVIHAVGPRLGQGDEETLLKQALRSAFVIAGRRGFRSLAFPGVSSGIFAVPHLTCARAYLHAVDEFFAADPETPLAEIRLVLFPGPLLETVEREWVSFWGRPG
jgi:O-acetyl-ADP-ribose deacetylase